MAFDSIKLEEKGGDPTTNDSDTIAIFAPNFEWRPSVQNDLTVNGLPGGNTYAQILDLSTFTSEVTIQGQFLGSENLPSEHQTALENMGFTLPVSAEEQVARLRDRVEYNPNPPYDLYLPNQEYTANSSSEINATQSVYPNVALSEMRTPREAGLARAEYLLRFSVGFVTGDQ